MPRTPALALLLLLGLGACGDDDLPPVGEGLPVDGPAGITPEDWGAHLFADHGCPACHGISSRPLVGPPLDRSWGETRTLVKGETVEVDEAYLRESILDPGARVVEGYAPTMPVYRGILTDAEVDALVAFLRQLR